MYQAWQWPTAAVNATESTVQQSTVAAVGAVSTPSVTPQWPTQTVAAYGQYAVPATMQQQWAAWQYAYPGNMAVGQVRPQYPPVPLTGAYSSPAQSYQAAQAYQNANTMWPEGYPAVQGASGETGTELQASQVPQSTDQHDPPKAEESGVATEQPKQEGDDLASLDKEAEDFERQFVEWEKQFENWKQQNISHPDREAFAEYEKQWQEWRNQLLQRREDMQRARAERKKNLPDDKPADGQSMANVPQLASNTQGFSSSAGLTPNVAQPVATPNQMIPGLDNIRSEQAMASHAGNIPSVSQGSQEVPAMSNQNLYYSSQMPPNNPMQNMFMPPPQQFPFPSGPPVHSQAPPHNQVPPQHGQIIPPHNQAMPLQNQVLPPHSQGPPPMSQFQVPRHPPPPPPSSSVNIQNDIDVAKPFMSSPDGYKSQEQKRPLLSTPPQHGAGSRGPPPQGGPGGLLPLPHRESRFGGPQNRDYGSAGNQEDMIDQSNQDFPISRGMNVHHEFDQRQDMGKQDERNYFMMGGDGKNDAMGYENQEPRMPQQEMDQNNFQDGWNPGAERAERLNERGRGRGRGYERETRPRGRGRGRGRESRWNDENDSRTYEREDMQFPGEPGNRNREFADNAGPPRDFPERPRDFPERPPRDFPERPPRDFPERPPRDFPERRSTRWGPPSKPLRDEEDMGPQSEMKFKAGDVHASGFGQIPDEGLIPDQEPFRNVDPYKGDDFKGRGRGDSRGQFKGDDQGIRPRNERSPFREPRMGMPHESDDYMGRPPLEDRGHFKGDEFHGRPPGAKGEEFHGRPPGAKRGDFKDR